MKKIKIAQVGTQHDHAINTYNSICSLTDIFDVVGLAEPGEKRMSFDGIEVTHTVEELLEIDGLEAVCIETEEEISTHYAQLFADKGIAIHLDKPGSEDVPAFEKLINTVKSNNIPFQMGYMYRYNPHIVRCMQEIKEGKLGKIFSIEAQMSVCHTIEKQKWLGKFHGGMMTFLGCHLIDLVLQIQGTPKNIITLNACTDFERLNGVKDFGMAVFEYENGSSVIKSCASEVNGYDRRQFVVCGSEGTFEIKPFEINPVGAGNPKLYSMAHITHQEQVSDRWKDCSEEIKSPEYDRYDPMMTDFAAFIREEKENPYTYDYELELFKTVMKCSNIL